MADDLVSVIMPAYNSEQLIEATIRSVINQSYQNWQLIVIDDCSKDKTCEVVKRLAADEPRIELLALDKNFGAPAGPRNVGIRHASGKWIAFLDSDDIWHPEKLTVQMKYLKQFGGRFCSSRMADFVDEKEIEFAPLTQIEVEDITFAMQLRRFRTATSSVIVDRELMLRCPFNEDPRYKAREDMECWLKIHEVIGKSIKLSATLLHYRKVEGQISGSKINMIKRTLLVLGEYQLASGKVLAWRKYLYLLTHIGYSVYFRVLKKSL